MKGANMAEFSPAVVHNPDVQGFESRECSKCTQQFRAYRTAVSSRCGACGYCKRCAGTGRFITRVENNVPVGPGGVCYRCRGKGWQSEKDVARNRTFDSHYTGQIC